MSSLLSKSKTLRAVRRLDPYEFEQFVADLWNRIGFQTHVRPGSGDRGIDIEAKWTRGPIEHQLVQVKRYSENNKVGSKHVREYATLYQQEDVDRVVIVTSGYFTNEGKRLAADLDVTTVDADALFRLIDSNADIAIEYLFDPDRSSYSPFDFVKSSSGQASREDVQESPFSDEENWQQVNSSQTHFTVCPECSSSNVWFGKLSGDKHLRCAACGASWQKIKREKQGLISSKEITGWKEYRGPNQGTFKPTSDWIS